MNKDIETASRLYVVTIIVLCVITGWLYPVLVAHGYLYWAIGGCVGVLVVGMVVLMIWSYIVDNRDRARMVAVINSCSNKKVER